MGRLRGTPSGELCIWGGEIMIIIKVKTRLERALDKCAECFGLEHPTTITAYQINSLCQRGIIDDTDAILCIERLFESTLVREFDHYN